MIWHLFSSTIYYVSYFICNNKFLILNDKLNVESTYLSGETVTNKKAVFYFDSSYHVVRKLYHPLLHHLIHVHLHGSLMLLLSLSLLLSIMTWALVILITTALTSLFAL